MCQNEEEFLPMDALQHILEKYLEDDQYQHKI